jgi:hypothetical protein
MKTGKTLFAQLIDFLRWTTTARYVRRLGGERSVSTLALHRAISHHGLRPIDLAREPAQHRS